MPIDILRLNDIELPPHSCCCGHCGFNQDIHWEKSTRLTDGSIVVQRCSRCDARIVNVLGSPSFVTYINEQLISLAA
jgi:hypothetical protein